MIKIIGAALAALVLMTHSAPAQENKPEGGGWVSLFNGKDLTNWVTPKGKHTWKILDGVIDYDAQGGNLVSAKKYGDYTLQIDWRFKRTSGAPYNAKLFDKDGNVIGKKAIPNADSGICVRGNGKSQVNLWCWPCGSGQLWAFHTSKDPELKKGACPKVNADKPVGEWNTMKITMEGEKIHVVLNGKEVINSKMPGIPKKGPIALQHHGGYNAKTKKYSSASALIQFRNIWIREAK